MAVDQLAGASSRVRTNTLGAPPPQLIASDRRVANTRLHDEKHLACKRATADASASQVR